MRNICWMSKHNRFTVIRIMNLSNLHFVFVLDSCLWAMCHRLWFIQIRLVVIKYWLAQFRMINEYIILPSSLFIPQNIANQRVECFYIFFCNPRIDRRCSILGLRHSSRTKTPVAQICWTTQNLFCVVLAKYAQHIHVTLGIPCNKTET